MFEQILEQAKIEFVGARTLAKDWSGEVVIFKTNTGDIITLYRSAQLDVVRGGKTVLTREKYDAWAKRCREIKAQIPKVKKQHFTGRWRTGFGGQWEQQY